MVCPSNPRSVSPQPILAWAQLVWPSSKWVVISSTQNTISMVARAIRPAQDVLIALHVAMWEEANNLTSIYIDIILLCCPHVRWQSNRCNKSYKIVYLIYKCHFTDRHRDGHGSCAAYQNCILTIYKTRLTQTIIMT